MIFKLIIIIGLLFSAGAVLMALIHLTGRPGVSQIKKDWLKFGVYMGLISFVLMIAYRGRWSIALMLMAISLGGAVELRANLKSRGTHPGINSNIFFLLLSAALGHLLLKGYSDWYSQFAFIFIIVSITDSFSQLWGRLLGEHKLCPKLSPGKTIEGLLGGLVTALAISRALSFLLPEIDLMKILYMGLILAASAVLGDLVFSYIKRRIGIKDFSGIIPGHGGILDRFDSLIVAAPVSYWAWKLIIR